MSSLTKLITHSVIFATAILSGCQSDPAAPAISADGLALSMSHVPGPDCTTATVPTAECEALVAFYNNTDGDNWIDNTGWMLSADPCSWFGVFCSGGVRRIELI